MIREVGEKMRKKTKDCTRRSRVVRGTCGDVKKSNATNVTNPSKWLVVKSSDAKPESER